MRKTSQRGGRTAPSLNALRTFEAVARLKSLTRAAGELNVTVSAVAFQLRQVEEALGTKLTSRSGRSIEIEAEGAELAGELGTAFGMIQQSLDRYHASQARHNVVTVSMLPGFAAMWLLPRMADLQQGCPRIDLRISTGERRVDLVAEGFDCAIRCGEGGWEGLRAERLFPQLLAPLYHRSYASRFGAPGSPQEMLSHKLIQNRTHPKEWEEWLAVAGAPTGLPQDMQEVQGREMVLAAVEAGLGIGLLDVSVLEREIGNGDLLQLFPVVLDTGWSHYLVTPEDREPSEACRQFRTWLLARSGASAATRAGTSPPEPVPAGGSTRSRGPAIPPAT